MKEAKLRLGRLIVHHEYRLSKVKDAVLHQESLVRAGLKPSLVVRTFQEDHQRETHREDEGGFLRHLYLQNGRSTVNLVNLWPAQRGNRIALLVVTPIGDSVL